METKTITVEGLTQLELRQLEDQLGKSAIKPIENASGKHHEPVTLISAALVLSIEGLKALTIILERPVKRGKRTITITNEGKTTTVNEEFYESGTTTSDQIEKIGKDLAINLKNLSDGSTSEGGGDADTGAS